MTEKSKPDAPGARTNAATPSASPPPAEATPSTPDRASPYPVSRLAPRFELVDVAREIAEADARLGEATHGKLAVILDQVRALQAQAQAIVEEARASRDLHRAECKFKRVPGRTYHLYERKAGALYFSMLSPDEWGGAAPHRFVGSFRLEADGTWTPADAVAKKDDARAAIASGRLLGR